MILENSIKYLAGAVIYAHHNGKIYFALINDLWHRWTVCKGKIESGETAEMAAIREAQEELGLTIIIQSLLGEKQHEVNSPDRGKYFKHVTYFLAEAKYQEIVIEKSEGMGTAKWIEFSKVSQLKTYSDLRPIFEKAIFTLQNSQSINLLN